MLQAHVPAEDAVLLRELVAHFLAGLLLVLREHRVMLAAHVEAGALHHLKVASLDQRRVCKCDGIDLALAGLAASEVQASSRTPAEADGANLLGTRLRGADRVDNGRKALPLARRELYREKR